MDCGKCYGQNHAATWRKLKTKQSLNQNLVELTTEAGLESINEDGVEKLLQAYGKSLTNDKLRELAEQCIQREFIV
jgi:hypothetical protein